MSPSLVSISPSHQPTWLKYRGCFNCASSQCICCKYIKVSDSFWSIATQETYKIKQYLNYNSVYVVHLVICERCKMQYIGSMSCSLKVRVRRHLSDIRGPFVTRMSTISAHCVYAHARNTSSLYLRKYIGLYEAGTTSVSFAAAKLIGCSTFRRVCPRNEQKIGH